MTEVSDLKFVTRNWNIINGQWNTSYDAGNEIIYSTEVLKFNLCDDNDAYILRKGNITIPGNTAVRAEFKRLCTIHWVYHKNW